MNFGTWFPAVGKQLRPRLERLGSFSSFHSSSISTCHSRSGRDIPNHGIAWNGSTPGAETVDLPQHARESESANPQRLRSVFSVRFVPDDWRDALCLLQILSADDQACEQ